MKKLLLVEHGGDTKSFIFEQLKTLHDVEIYIIATRFPTWLDEYVDSEHRLVSDTYNAQQLQLDVALYAENNKIQFDGVGTFFEHVVVQTAELAKSLNLPGINPDAARISSSNKFLMRTTCRNNGVEMPNFVSVTATDRAQLLAELSSFGFPCVVKPVFGSQSYGVKKFTKTPVADELEEIFELTTQANKEVFKNFTQTFLIEEYMSGPVISVDGFIQNGEITFAGSIEFVMGPEPHFTQEANSIPCPGTEDEVLARNEYTKKVIRALGFDNCGFHCELRVTPNGPRLIEIACRLPGGPLQLGYAHAYGFVLAFNLVDIWLGKNTDLIKTQNNFVIQKAVFPRATGTITALDGVDEVKKLSGVWDFAQICMPGELIITYPNVPKPFYYYAAEAGSHEELVVLMQTIEKTVAVTVA